MTTPEQDPTTPPPSVAPVVVRTSPAATIPADAPLPPLAVVPVPPAAAPVAPLSAFVAEATASTSPVDPLVPSPLPSTLMLGTPGLSAEDILGTSSASITSLDHSTLSTLSPELLAQLQTTGGLTALSTTLIAPTPAPEAITHAPVKLEAPADEPTTSASASDDAPAEDPLGDVDTVQVVNTVKMIEPGENPNVHQEFITEKKDSRGGPEALGRPGVQQVVFPDMVADSMKNNLDHPAAARQDDAASRRWSQILLAGTTAIPSSEMLQDISTRPDAEFRQYLKTERNKVGFSAPTFQDVAGAKLTGERAVQRVRALMGQGGLIMVPLWHSGFHVTIKTPSESALIEARRRMENESIQLGRYTFGMAFSNTASYTVNILMDLVLEHIYETSLKDQTELRTKIESLDIPILMWGMACAVWPNGFQYARGLTTEIGILKNEVVTGLIDVGKLMWVDNKAFTAKQKAHMSNRQVGTMTAEQVQAYKEDFPLRSGRLVELAPGISVEFAPPTVEAYIASGRRWVEKIVQVVEGMITNDREDIEGRNRVIIQHGNATYMRQLGHWVKLIKLGEDTVEDQENIEIVLETLSESDKVREAYINGYRQYVNDITTAIIAIPEAAPNDLTVPRFPNLIAIDVISTFFTLLMQRVSQLTSR